MRLLRFHIGRALLHAGLRALRPGRVRSELSALMDVWATRVRQETAFIISEKEVG